METAVREQTEPEDLSDVELCIPDQTRDNIAAQERINVAQNYTILSLRAVTTRASVAANKGVGNTDAVSKFEGQLKEIEVQIAHCLRSIKAIDREYPRAKKMVMDISEQQKKAAVK